MVRSSVRGWPKGLISDAIGVSDALLEAFDVYIDRAGELRFRGAKVNVSPSVPVGGVGLDGFAYSNARTRAFAAHPRLGQIFVGSPGDVPAGSFTEVVVKKPVDVAWTAVGRRHVVPLGGAADTTWAARIVFGLDRAFLIPEFADMTVPLALGAIVTGTTMWGGSNKAAYSTGTVSTTAGSTTVIGVGTLWLANIDVGMFISAGGNFASRVVEVVSNTSLRMEDPALTTTAAVAYSARPLVALPGSAAAWGAGKLVAGGAAAVHQERLYMGAVYSFATDRFGPKPHRLVWSAAPGERDPVETTRYGIEHWNINAFEDIGVGVGSRIVGLASFGGSLLVLKDIGVYVRTGDDATDGSDKGGATQLISDQVGCPNAQAYDVAEDGVYFADARGAYRFNREGLTTLTAKRIEKEWRANMPGTITVSALRERVVFQGGPNRDQIYVWDAKNEAWFRQRVRGAYSPIARVFDTAGLQVTESAPQRVTAAGDVLVDDWATDRVPGTVTGTGTDENGTTTPRADITTHPLPASKVKGQRGRPVKVLIEAFIQLFALPTIPEIEPSVTFGERLVGEPGDGTTVVLGTITPADSTGVAKRRIPVSANTAAAMVRLRQEDDAADGAFYAVTLESAETGRHAG